MRSLCLSIVSLTIAFVGPTFAEDDYARRSQLLERIDKLCAKLPGDPNCRGLVPITCESDTGDKCVCGAGQTCESTETSCACFTAQRPGVSTPRVPIGPTGLVARPQPHQFATLDVKCGADTYTISTGNDSGNCSSTSPGSGGGGGGSCSDGSGNGATVSCDTGCTSSSGAGSCTGP